jgi:outer membrane lipoprotein SlyB
MKIVHLFSIGLIFLLLNGCSLQREQHFVSYNIKKARVVDVQKVIINDGDQGENLGRILGAAAGYAMDGGVGKFFNAIAGAYAGGYAGREFTEQVGQRVIVETADGAFYKVTVLSETLYPNQEVELAMHGDKVMRVLQ